LANQRDLVVRIAIMPADDMAVARHADVDFDAECSSRDGFASGRNRVLRSAPHGSAMADHDWIATRSVSDPGRPEECHELPERAVAGPRFAAEVSHDDIAATGR
jgi:hypothetical protein